MVFEQLLEIGVRGGLDHPGQHLEDLRLRVIDPLQFVHEQIVQRCELRHRISLREARRATAQKVPAAQEAAVLCITGQQRWKYRRGNVERSRFWVWTLAGP